jgi:hypothetical protein
MVYTNKFILKVGPYITCEPKTCLFRMMQKDKLRQDVFLIGPPGPLRRALVMKYAQMTKRE